MDFAWPADENARLALTLINLSRLSAFQLWKQNHTLSRVFRGNFSSGKERIYSGFRLLSRLSGLISRFFSD